jgi:hypothetical protein
MSNNYINPPPDIPLFMYKHYPKVAVAHLIQWAKKEHSDRLIYCAEHGYWRELKRLNEGYSPMIVLSELKEFRKIIIPIVKGGWDKLSMRERAFIRRAYEARELLS